MRDITGDVRGLRRYYVPKNYSHTSVIIHIHNGDRKPNGVFILCANSSRRRQADEKRLGNVQGCFER